MSGSVMLARKEAFEILRTWRIYVLPAILLFFAATGPLLAKYMPELLTALAGEQFAALTLPAPTVFDAYGQWIKNLSQIAIFAIIIIYGGIVSSERRSGTAILALTKPVSRGAFVVVKAVVHILYLAVILAVGTLLTWGTSAIIFGDAPGGALWAAAWIWFALAAFYLSLMTLFSVLISSAAGAAGAGLGVFVVLSIAGLWKPLADFSPAGLMGRATTVAAGVETESVLWPILVTTLLCVAVVALAAALFRRQEL